LLQPCLYFFLLHTWNRPEIFLKDFFIGIRAVIDERTILNLCDDEKVAYSGLQSAWGSAAPQGNALLDDQLIEPSGDIDVLTVVTGELIVVGFLEPSTPFSVVNEKSANDGVLNARATLRNAGRRAIPWRGQSVWVGVYVDIDF
jgi:hypothetical protein